MSKMIKLMSSDGEKLEVEEAVALQSQTLKNLVEDIAGDDVIPVPNVTGEILRKSFEYCRRHAAAGEKAGDEDDLKNFDSEFMKVDTNTLYDLIMAANYLNIKTLLSLTCETVANMIKEKTPSEIREMFKITNDYTEEEEKQVLKDNSWAFQTDG